MQNLPDIYQPRKSIFSRFLLSLVSIFIMLAAIPVGVYLVSQRTNFLPQANNESNINIKDMVHLKLINSTGANLKGEIPIDVVIQTSKEPINLISTKITYPKDLLKVKSIATSSAQEATQYAVNKWIESSFDNDKGEIILLGGILGSGLGEETEKKLTTIIFEPVSSGLAQIMLDPNSALFDSQTSQQVKVSLDNLKIVIPNIPKAPPQPTCAPRPVCLDQKKACKITPPAAGWCAALVSKNAPKLQLISPRGGEVFSYNSLIPIEWVAENVGNIEILVSLNDKSLGRIASVSGTTRTFKWNVQQFITSSFIQKENTYKLQLIASSKLGPQISTSSAAPFGLSSIEGTYISASQSANLAKRGGDANKDGRIDLSDLSLLLTFLNSSKQPFIGVDLNGDNVVNDIDIYFLKNKLQLK